MDLCGKKRVALCLLDLGLYLEHLVKGPDGDLESGLFELFGDLGVFAGELWRQHDRGRLTGLGKGGVSVPVRTASGYQIVKLVDFRKVPAVVEKPIENKVADAGDELMPEPRAELTYKQILMNMKPDAKEQEAELLLKLAREVAKKPGKCADKSMAGADDLQDVDFTVTLNRAVSEEMPDKLRELLMMMNVGGVSQPVVTPQGIRLFMLCERIELPADKSLAKVTADSSATKQAIYAQKLELEAQKYMRDLKRSAFIETRIQ